MIWVVKELKRKKIMKDTLFSPLLVEKVREALSRGEQAILFQNRRGFAPMIECRGCGWVPHCVNCDVSLTYHKAHNQLVCHYCGYTYRSCARKSGKFIRLSALKIPTTLTFPKSNPFDNIWVPIKICVFPFSKSEMIRS